jgi:hypothetical protein
MHLVAELELGLGLLELGIEPHDGIDELGLITFTNSWLHNINIYNNFARCSPLHARAMEGGAARWNR